MKQKYIGKKTLWASCLSLIGKIVCLDLHISPGANKMKLFNIIKTFYLVILVSPNVILNDKMFGYYPEY